VPFLFVAIFLLSFLEKTGGLQKAQYPPLRHPRGEL